MENPFKKRLIDLYDQGIKQKLDAIILFGESNIKSLVGYSCDNACLIIDIKEDSYSFYTDSRYDIEAKRLAPWLDVHLMWDETKSESRFFKNFSKQWKRIGFEGSITASRYIVLSTTLKKTKFIDVENDILSLRSVKTPYEIRAIAKAEAMTDKVWSLACEKISYGMTEKEIRKIIRGIMNELGADGEAFPTIVCAGANSAECHHIPDDTVWEKGEPLLVDMGVKLDGYCSDMTRNIPALDDEEYMKIYRIVLKANKAAIKAAKKGMTCKEIDDVARKIISDAGYAKEFCHSLGHGVGIDIHESPTLHPRFQSSLEENMVVTIEPGIYIAGKFGVRIEDLIVITSKGSRRLSHSSK